MTTLYEARLGSRTLWVVGKLDEDTIFGNAIVLDPSDYEHGRPSYAHVYGDTIGRLGKILGYTEDLVFTGQMNDVEGNEDELDASVAEGQWKRPNNGGFA